MWRKKKTPNSDALLSLLSEKIDLLEGLSRWPESKFSRSDYSGSKGAKQISVLTVITATRVPRQGCINGQVPSIHYKRQTQKETGGGKCVKDSNVEKGILPKTKYHRCSVALKSFLLSSQKCMLLEQGRQKLR